MNDKDYASSSSVGEILPPVPQWWWDYGMKQQLDEMKREAQAFDENIKAISDVKK